MDRQGKTLVRQTKVLAIDQVTAPEQSNFGQKRVNLATVRPQTITVAIAHLGDTPGATFELSWAIR
jgi:hypothetical protein